MAELILKNKNRDELFSMGENYYRGQGVEKDKFKAVLCYTEAAEQGHFEALIMLGNCFYYGDGVAQNFDKAFYWLDKVVSDDLYYIETDGCFLLGECYYWGRGVKRDYSKAFECYKKVVYDCIMDLSLYKRVAKYYLGFMYMHGQGTEKDDIKAVQMFIESAEGGQKYAQYELAQCYMKGVGIQKDCKKAIDWFIKSGKNGYSKAYYELGRYYAIGIELEKNADEAMKYFTAAAEIGNDDAKKAIADYRAAGRFNFNSACSNSEADNISDNSSSEGYIKKEEVDRITAENEALKKLKKQQEKEISRLKKQQEQERASGSSVSLDDIYNQNDMIINNQKSILARQNKTQSTIERNAADIRNDISDIKGQLSAIQVYMTKKLPTIIAENRQILQKNIQKNAADTERYITEFCSEITDKIVEQTGQQDELKNKVKAELINKLGKGIWNSLEEITKNRLIAARVFWESSKEISGEDFDYCGVCVSVASALEKELLRYFYTGFQQYLEDENIPLQDWPYLLSYYDSKNHKMKKYNKDKFSIGNLPFIFGRTPKDKAITQDKLQNLNCLRNQYLEKIVKDTYLKKTECKQASDCFTKDMFGLGSGLVKQVDQICGKYRNPAAHGGRIYKDMALACCDRIIGKLEAQQYTDEIDSIIKQIYALIDIHKAEKYCK
ncbi:MAG: SEL1-like repeat protein [Oscillospiraceae bacterium]|nr:SEL1-like repeat protein [Oscillospiraceae bacterium]